MPTTAKTSDGMTERQLALWMLDKMQHSLNFLDHIRAARIGGARDALDAPEFLGRHKDRLKRLYQGDEEESVDVSSTVAGVIEALVERDALSSREELIEKALAAYLEKHPENAKELPREWAATIDLARAEIEGRTSGMFHTGFVAELADAARTEMARQAEVERDRGRDRGGRES